MFADWSWTPEKRGAQGPGIGLGVHRSDWRRLRSVEGGFGGVGDSRTDDVQVRKTVESHNVSVRHDLLQRRGDLSPDVCEGNHLQPRGRHLSLYRFAWVMVVPIGREGCRRCVRMAPNARRCPVKAFRVFQTPTRKPPNAHIIVDEGHKPITEVGDPKEPAASGDF